MTDYKKKLDESPMSAFQMIIIAICFILNFNDGIDVLVVSFSSPEIIKEWGLNKTEMGYIFSAGLAGMTLGCFVLAPWADTIGRRKMFLISLMLISFGMLAVAFTTSYPLMLVFRFITGFGIGGILPTMTATAAEFSNRKHRDFSVSLVQAGWPVGAILTGFFCAYFIPKYGWHNAFLVAGCISTLMLVLVYVYMTDSVEFLLKSRPENALTKVNEILKKMKQPTFQTLPLAEVKQHDTNFKDLFSIEYKNSTIKLWIAAFFGFMTLYTLMSWIPTIAKEAGLPFEMATYVGIMQNLGAAIGSASIGAIGSRYGLRKSQLSFMILAFVVMQFYANLTLTTPIIFVLVFLIGMFVQGGFNGIWSILARIYAAEIRATGVGFTVGIGRLGAILGPVVFGYCSDNQLSTNVIFTIFSLPLLVMGAMIWSLKSKNL